MKIGKNSILALSLAFLLALPIMTALSPAASAENSIDDVESLPVEAGPWDTKWYKFETPLITLIFPAGGKKPMFLWWYTEDNSTIYVVKFQGLIEYLVLDKPYYRHRFHADNVNINATLWRNHIEPALRKRFYEGMYRWRYQQAVNEFLGLLLGLHSSYLPFSACGWNLEGPVSVTKGDVSYWSFNFTLNEVYGHPRLEFAEDNIQIRCRFYNTTATEVPDETHSDYNYTVAAGQLKFDFVVKHWEWNIDKINQFLKRYELQIPESRSGLALWINMASINIEDLPCAENEVQYQAENQVETRSRMQQAIINGEPYAVDRNETDKDENPVQATLQIRERFREHVKLQFVRGVKEVPVGFLAFVPWARQLYSNGTTFEYVDVTASYVAAGGYLRLFVCYPYFADYILEHDPTIGLTAASTFPRLFAPQLLWILVGVTAVIGLVVAAARLLKKPVNVLTLK
ncbi:MAG: hypothetical protein QW717_04380 [Candidatus Bathyarchaeia archaeon]